MYFPELLESLDDRIANSPYNSSPNNYSAAYLGFSECLW